MFVRTLVKFSLLSALVIPSALVVTACGNGTEVKHATVKAGEMPAGGEWQGVYYSPVYGYLHLLVDGKTAQGAWRTGGGDAYGELQGEVDGNVMKYTWTQHKIGMVGAEANSNGKGYFVYSIPKEGEAHKISGEWGLGDSDAGNKWEAVKQTNMQPNLSSVKPDEIEGKVNAGGWDDDNKGGADTGDKGDKGSSKKKSNGEDTPSEP